MSNQEQKKAEMAKILTNIDAVKFGLFKKAKNKFGQHLDMRRPDSMVRH